MQQPYNKLIEIIWEITSVCNQKCSYCGSKDYLNRYPIDREEIKSIADNIATYPPENLDISGGNPLLVPYDVHEYIVNLMHGKGVTCKIILNPFNIAPYVKNGPLEDQPCAVGFYDWVGLSINTYDELQFVRDSKMVEMLDRHVTIITNFNTTNMFQFGVIENFVKKNGLTWQIQYTMYEEGGKDEHNAIYKNELALTFMNQMLDESAANIIKADNMNNGICGAGNHSLGVLSDGSVIPCLSMRSWAGKNQLEKVVGNLNVESMKQIWTYGFAELRCSEFKCCKDVCQAKDPEICITANVPEDMKPIWIPAAIEEPWKDIVVMYGVFPVQPKVPKWSDGTFVYAVVMPDAYKNISHTFNLDNIFNKDEKDE